MRTFIQLRDGVGYATLNTPNEQPDHTVTPDHTTAIEVFTDNADQFLKMKYDAETKSWSSAPLIIYGVLDELGNIIEIARTVYAHEAEGHVLIPEDFQRDWQWVNNEWVKPVPIDTTRYQISPGVYADDVLIIEAPAETKEQRLAQVREATGNNE